MIKKPIRVFLIATLLLAALGVGLWYFAVWSVRGAFDAAARKDFEPLASVLEASLGRTLARGDSGLHVNGREANGVMDFYKANPEALRKDKDYFKTWSAALNIAHGRLQSANQDANWQSSENLAWLSPESRADAWNHAFCVRSENGYSLVISAGSQALTSLNCNELRVNDEALETMPRGRLNLYASGTLILVLKSGEDRHKTGVSSTKKP